ncbi:hypothetical protein [Candidatus Minimicrobia naudis]
MAIAVALTPTINITAPNENKSDAKKVISAKIFSEIKSPSSLSTLKCQIYRFQIGTPHLNRQKNQILEQKKKSHIQYQQRAISDQI